MIFSSRRLIGAVLLTTLIAAAGLMAAEQPVPAGNPPRFQGGVIMNMLGVGLQTEYRFIPAMGLRLSALHFPGLPIGGANPSFVKQGEYVLSFMAGPATHIATPHKDIEALVIFGVEYSRYRWTDRRWRRGGYINDLTGGMGVGVAWRFHPHAVAEVIVWANNDYRIARTPGRKMRHNRCLLVLPLFSVGFCY